MNTYLTRTGDDGEMCAERVREATPGTAAPTVPTVRIVMEQDIE